MPVTVVTGARQTGKTTLVRGLTPGEQRYASLDEPRTAQLARRDPRTLLGGDALTLDEVQREPGLLSAVKPAVDEEPFPGRFLLTGSANLLLMRRVSEEHLVLRRCACWVSLTDAPESANEYTVTVSVPARNRFDVEGLANLMERARKETLS